MWIVIICAGFAAGATPRNEIPIGPGLRALAAPRHLDIGAAVAIEPLAGDPRYRDALARDCSILTSENVMKFGPIHPEPDRYAFEAADALVAFAQQHGMRVRGHALVWHEQLAPWVTERQRTREEWQRLLHDHISAVVGHYKGRVYAWDVVNEAVAEDGTLRETPWLKGIGPDYLEMAFRWAHEADPDAKLFYNDYGESNERKQKAIHRLLRDLLKKGAPIHGAGLQMHMDVDSHPRPSAVARAITRLHRLGLEVHVTEMDVAVPEPFTDRRLGEQAELYRKMMRTCLDTKGCTAFITWGISDRYSWIPAFRRGWGAALPLDAEFQAKPGYRAIRDALSR
ncbi:MAG: endo-1,4-beta-xylanase [Candidatus Hydrogenedentes bacterium]|nr:endo-1,4-beta-xylanase [Candidatus Hydrogenedentota bacterium]